MRSVSEYQYITTVYYIQQQLTKQYSEKRHLTQIKSHVFNKQRGASDIN